MNTPGRVAIHETVLYADDVGAAAGFYARVLGLSVVSEQAGMSAALRMPEGDAVLLVFHPDAANTPGRGVPTHGGGGCGGRGHVAFRIAVGSFDTWRERLTMLGVAIELERSWERGGRSMYVRDPAGNSVELVEGRVWPDAPTAATSRALERSSPAP